MDYIPQRHVGYSSACIVRIIAARVLTILIARLQHENLVFRLPRIYDTNKTERGKYHAYSYYEFHPARSIYLIHISLHVGHG